MERVDTCTVDKDGKRQEDPGGAHAVWGGSKQSGVTHNSAIQRGPAAGCRGLPGTRAGRTAELGARW
jgi:hypothetical protein